MTRGAASGGRRLLAAMGVSAALVAGLPTASATPRDHRVDCACAVCAPSSSGWLGQGGLPGGDCSTSDAAGEDPRFCGLLVTAAGGCASGFETGWVRADYVLWQRDGVRLPPLATASPTGTPVNQQAILGFPDTSVLAGDETVSDRLRSGWTFEAGVWLNSCTGWALAADYFSAGRDGYGFQAGPNDGRIIGRPFFNTQTGQENARILHLPGELSGSVGVSAFDDLQGAGAWMQKCVWRRGDACAAAGGATISLRGGYRYYHQDSLVVIREEYVALAANSFGLPEGQVHLAADKFSGRNEFHGFELGLSGRFQRCRWWCEGLAAVALGGSRRVVFVEGTTLNVDPGLDPQAFQGALLTSGVTNFGRYADDQCHVVPRFRLGAGWQWSERIGVRMGYNLVVWDAIVQAADHLPPGREIDPRNLPEITTPGGAEPVFPGLRGTTLVGHGLDLAVTIDF